VDETDAPLQVVSAELKPGERKIISNGSDGPVVEIIKRSTAPAEPPETAGTQA